MAPPRCGATAWGQNVAVRARWADTPATARCEVYVRLPDGLELPRRSAEYDGVAPCAELARDEARRAAGGAARRRGGCARALHGLAATVQRAVPRFSRG